GVGQPGAHRPALADVAPMAEQARARPARLLLQDLPGAVRRRVVDDDQLLGNVDGAHAPQELTNRVALVIDRDDDRNQQVVGDCGRGLRSHADALPLIKMAGWFARTSRPVYQSHIMCESPTPPLAA